MSDSDPYAKDVARTAAAYAHTGWISKRWAILPSDDHYLVVADNNPIAKGRDWRHEVFDRLTQWLVDEHGCTLVATASYPEDGKSDGYTVAQVYQGAGGQPDHEEVAEVWGEFWVEVATHHATTK